MRKFICYTISSTLFFLMTMMTILMMKGWALESSRPEDVPPEEKEDEELEPASDEDGREIFNMDSEDDA
jgi:hypothetical protein